MPGEHQGTEGAIQTSLADLSLRLAGSGGAEGSAEAPAGRIGRREPVQEQGTGAAAWMRRLTWIAGLILLRPVKLAGRIGNHLNRNCVLNPSGRRSDRGIFGRSARASWYQLGTGSDEELGKMPGKALGLW